MPRLSPGWLLAGACLLAMPAASDAGAHVRFERLVPEFQNKPVTGIASSFQDPEGFLWFGTATGLARYDGNRFVFFSPPSGAEGPASALTVYPVIEDRAGDIWVGTAGAGLLKFSKVQEKFIPYRPGQERPAGTSGDIILAIQEDQRGDLWVGTRLSGLGRLDKKTGTYARFPLRPEAETVWDLLVDRRGSLWVGTQEGGLFRLDPETGEMINYRWSPDNPSSLGSNTVWSIFEDRTGTIWIGTNGGGLNRYNADEDSFIRFYGDKAHARDLASSTITAVAEDGAGRLWIGTSSNGLRVWDGATGEYVVYRHGPQDPESLSDDNITFIRRDASGVMWTGTTRGGVNKSLAGQAKFEHFKHNPQNPSSLSHNEVLSLWLSRFGSLWVGLRNGLDKVDEELGVTARFSSGPARTNSPSDRVIQAVAEDGRGRVWLGTESGGLNGLDPRTGAVTTHLNDPRDPTSLSHNNVHVLWPERENPNILWVGTHHGLNRFDTARGTFARFLNEPSNPKTLSGNIVTALYEDRAGFFWVGTRAGLNKMDMTTGTCERYVAHIKDPPGKSINDNIINCLLEDSRGFLWAGTDNGLERLDRKKNEWTTYGTRGELRGAVVCGVLEDESGSLWVSTNGGLARFDPQTETFTAYGIHDGLQSEQFSPRACIKDPDGTLFFGGVNGYNAFRPAAVTKNPFVPPVAWTGFLRNGQNVDIGSLYARPRSLKLSARADVYAFEFAALCFVEPGLNRFAYMLEPRDREWISLGMTNSVTLSGLRAGEYRLRVKGSNPDGVGNDAGFEVRLQVVRPFWRTPWFIGLAVLFVASGVATVLRMWLKLKSAFTVVGERADGVIASYGLTPREQEILRLVLQGATNQDIEKKLFVSASTVRNHIYNIYQKLGVRNRLELVNLIAKDARK